MERNYDLEKRKYVIGGAVIVIVLIFLIRLLSLQIMSEDYKKNADSNAFLKKIQYPSRGVIYDRNEKLLVYNQAAYDITVIMKEITELDTMDLCQTLKISPEFLRKKFRDDFVIGINKGVRHFSLALKDGIGVRGNGENFKVGVNRAARKFHTDAVGEIALRQALRKSKCRAALSSPHFAAGGQPGAQLCRPRRIPATEP